MGILNLTPDSFSGDGVLGSPLKAATRAQEMEEAGADLIDLGAESTRPGARPIPEKEEQARLLPVLKKIRKRIRIPISVDTQNSNTARMVLSEGTKIINDVSCFRKDSGLAEVIAQFKAGLILMHSRGTPQTMSLLNDYRALIPEVIQELKLALTLARKAGIPRKAIAVDPGAGFAKVGAQNLELIRSIERFRKIGYPICLGISRKSVIGTLVGEPPHERDYGSTALHSLMIERGVNILRVHNVQAAKQAVAVTKEFLKYNSPIPS